MPSLIGTALGGGTIVGGGEAALPPAILPVTINATRTSGVAPLAVSFETSAAPELVDPADAHLNWDWVWDYDDAGAGTWGITGLSKNADLGPIGAHVFETPGTYTVVGTVTNPTTGQVYQGSVEVTVSDPDVVFAGTATRCYSVSGDFTGAPAGATLITESDFRVILADMAAGRRLLLRAGEAFTFSSFISPNEPVGPGYIGRFGAGANPTVTAGSDTAFIGLINSGDVLRDWRFIDLSIANGGAGAPANSFFFAVNGGTAHQLTFLRCTFDRFRINVQLQMNNTTRNEELAFVECVTTNTDFVGLFPSCGEQMILGNDLDAPTQEHTIRSHYYPRSVFAHNHLRGAPSGRHAMKMCALATNASNPLGTNGETELTTWSGYQSAEFWSISDNIIDADSTEFTVAVGPQSADYDERVRYGVVQRNTLNVGANTVWHCVFWTNSCVFKDNVCDSIAKDTGGWLTELRGIEPNPDDNHAFDNQFRYASLPATGPSISIDTGGGAYNLASTASGNTDTL